MRKNLFYTLLLTCGFAACADHTGTSIVTDGPQAPINEPDTRVIEPNGSSGSNANSGGGNGLEGNSGSGGSNQGGGTGTGGGNGSSAGSGGEGGEGGEGGNGGNPPGGGEGGSPVPEPGTLLLVGTGLAGLAGASLRRRQKKAN